MGIEPLGATIKKGEKYLSFKYQLLNNKVKMTQGQVIKIVTIILLLQIQSNLILSQVKNCFKSEKILPVRYEPSKKLKLKSSGKNEIVFRVSKSYESQILENRLIELLNTVKDSLTTIQVENIKKAANKFRVSLIANQTDTIIEIPHILRRITLIQEAKDTNGTWRPIESSSNNLWCGNTNHGMIELQPNEYIEIYLRKYCGEFQTKMRMKLQLRNRIVYSEEYEGFVNPEMFDSIDFPNNKYFIDISVEEEFKRVKKIKKEGGT